MKRQELVGMLSLLLTALIWGFAFVAQVQGMDSMSPMFFNAARFTLGALSLVPILLWMRGRGSADKGDTAGADVVGTEASVAVSTDAASNGASDVVTITGAKLNANKPDSAVARLLANPVVISVICGIVLFTASTLQQYGILYGKSAGRAGFLTAMYIVMVPLLAFVFLRRRIGMLVFVAVALSIAGFYLLCITDGFGSIGLADILLVFTAVLFAVHILVIDTLGGTVDAIKLSFGQFCTTAVLSWAGSLDRRLGQLGRRCSFLDSDSVRRHRLGGHRVHLAGGRPAMGAADASQPADEPRIVLLGGRRCVAAR